jgi:hypothetical protein
MAIKDDDLLYVQRPTGLDSGKYKETFGNIKDELLTDGTGNDIYLSRVNDDTAEGDITFEKDVRVEGVFASSRKNQTDAVQVVPTNGSSQSSTLQITRAATSSGTLPAVEVLQNAVPTAEIAFDGTGTFSDVKVSNVTSSVGLGTDSNGKIIDSEAALDARYLSATEDDTAAGEITFKGSTTHEGGINLTGGGAGYNLYRYFSVYRLASPDDKSIFQVQNADTASSDVGNTVILGTAKPEVSSRHSIRLQGRASVAGQNLVVAQAVPYLGGFDVNSVTGFYTGGIVPESAANKPNEYRCFQASASTGFSPLIYGFYSDINTGIASGPDASTNYAVFCDGTAPSHFNGVTEHANGVKVMGGDLRVGSDNDHAVIQLASGSMVSRALKLVRSGSASPSIKAIEVIADGAIRWSVGYDGTAAFSALSGTTAIQMDADNPTAFTSTFELETDEEGNEVQVENSTYTGTTETLLDIIRDLRARVTQLEDDHATMMNNNGGGY